MTLNDKLVYFIHERIEEEIYEKDKYRENENDAKSYAIMQEIETNYGKNTEIFNLVNEMRDLQVAELVEMMEVAYRLGFKDGLKFENVMCNI